MKQQAAPWKIMLPVPDDRERERGAILVIVLVLIFAVTLAVMAYLYLNKNNTLIASNLAVQNAAQEATDQGLQSAAQWLQNNNPNTAGVGGYFQSMTNVPSSYGSSSSNSAIPVAPGAGFWSSCAANSQCFSLPQAVSYGPYTFHVNWVIFPSAGVPMPLSGYQITGASTPTATYYTVFVHAQKTSGGLGVTVQSTVRVVN